LGYLSREIHKLAVEPSADGAVKFNNFEETKLSYVSMTP